jgi:hypothetical protein
MVSREGCPLTADQLTVAHYKGPLYERLSEKVGGASARRFWRVLMAWGPEPRRGDVK